MFFRGNLEFPLCCGADTTLAVEDPFRLVGPTMRGPLAAQRELPLKSSVPLTSSAHTRPV